MLVTSHGWGISARAHVQGYPHTALLYLRNGLADCVQIWYVGWGSLTKCLPQVIDGVHLHVRTCAHIFHKCSACCFLVTVGPISVEIWYALGNPLVTAYAVVTDGVSLHVRTCRPRFCISGTAWPIEFNFGVWVSSPYLSPFHKSWVGYLCTCARADRASVSQERLGRLSSILVCELGVTS